MLRFISILLLSIYLISFTEFKEILRMPLLVEHYVEHKSQVNEMSFLQYLVMHYKTDIPHDDTDMSLPFKDCSHPFSGPTVLPVQKIFLSEVALLDGKEYQSYYLQHEPKMLAFDIFQPPKI